MGSWVLLMMTMCKSEDYGLLLMLSSENNELVRGKENREAYIFVTSFAYGAIFHDSSSVV